MPDFENEMSTPTVEDMRAAFGLDTEDAGAESGQVDETSTPEEGQSETSSENSADTSQAEGEQTEADAQQQQQQQANQQTQQQARIAQDNKQNQAFARMRTENAQMQKALGMVAQALGINPKLPLDQLSSQLQAQALQAVARKNNIDPQILARLDQLEAINAEYTRAKLEKTATESLQNIQEKYGATEGDLTQFVDEIVADGFDISVPGANLEQEFIRRNFEKIMQNKINAAVAAEQTRAAKAGSASQPSKKQGQEDNSEPHDINTVEDLDNFFRETLK